MEGVIAVFVADRSLIVHWDDSAWGGGDDCKGTWALRNAASGGGSLFKKKRERGSGRGRKRGSGRRGRGRGRKRGRGRRGRSRGRGRGEEEEEGPVRWLSICCPA